MAFPVGAIAASAGPGVVLSVHRNAVQVVGANHVVHAYGYRGKSARLRAGSEVAFSLAGQTMSGVRVVGVTRTVSD